MNKDFFKEFNETAQNEDGFSSNWQPAADLPEEPFLLDLSTDSQLEKEKDSRLWGGSCLKPALRLLGYWLFSFALAVLLLTFWPAVSFEFSYFVNKLGRKHFVLDPADLKRLPSGLASVIAESDIQILSPIDRDFGLVIPKIGLNTKVFANTDINDEKKYDQVLSQGVAHALGTSFPGQKGTIFIFGHSTDLSFETNKANSIFYPLNKLEAGDEIDVFYNNWRYVYQVTDKKIVVPEDISFLDSRQEEKLVLQTCWPPGTRWQRLVIVAEPIHHITLD